MSLVVDAKGRDLRSVSTELKESIAKEPVIIQGAAQLHGLVAGFKSGEVIIEGESGDYLGVLNAGATIRVQGNAGCYLADNMTCGLVIVDGGWLLAILPPGAFFSLALAIAAKNALDRRRRANSAPAMRRTSQEPTG